MSGRKLDRFGRIALYLALSLILTLLLFDRAAAWLHRPAPDSTGVTLYTTGWCPYCRSLRLYLDAYDIPYKDYDVEKSLSGIMGFWTLRGRGVPVSVIGPEVVYGYDLEKINRSLAALGYKVEE
ncbi:MAG TPA: glutaredoxin domain-containing protein [Gammaproteobacteria bacterium]